MEKLSEWMIMLFLCFTFFLMTAVPAFEITVSKSVEAYQINKPFTITWTVTYDETMKSKTTMLYLQDGNREVELANNMDGVSETVLVKLFGDKVNITKINAFKVKLDFQELLYTDKFNFTCKAYGGTLMAAPERRIKTISITNVKGGISQCGFHRLENEYTFPPGKSNFPLSLCGYPKPVVEFTIGNSTFTAEGELSDGEEKAFDYKIEWDVSPKHCGQTLKLNAKGFKKWKNESRIWVKYTPSKVAEFQFIKNVSQNGNCTIFKMANQNHGNCSLIYNIYLYDSSNNLVDSLSGVTEHEWKKCYTNQTRFDRIAMANVEAVQMGLVGPMFDQPIDHLLLVEGIEPTEATTTVNTITEYNSTQSTPELDQPGTPKISWMPYDIPLILGAVIVLLVILIFVIHCMKKHYSSPAIIPDEEVVLNYDTKKVVMIWSERIKNSSILTARI